MKGQGLFKFLTLIIGLILLWIIGRHFYFDSAALEAYLTRHPVAFSGIVFILLYVVLTFFIWFSKDILRLISAVIFGAYLSTFLIWIAETVNALILFSLARSLGREFVESRFKIKPGAEEKFSNLNFIWLFLFRSVPLIPFRFLDLGMGLTGIRFEKYLLAVIIGSPLRIFWMQFILAGVGKAFLSNPGVLVDYLAKHGGVFIFSLLYLILVVVVAVKLKKKV